MTDPPASVMRTVGITGATGFVGSAMGREFHRRGYVVVAIGRQPPGQAPWAAGFRRFDLELETSDGLLAGIDVLIHAAYIKHSPGRPTVPLNAQAARRLIEAADEVGVRRRIFLSSLSARTGARSEYGRQKRAIEQLFCTERDTVVRAGLVLGHGGLFAAMRDHIMAKRPIPLVDGGHQPVQTVHVDDLVQAVGVAVERELSGCLVVAERVPVPYKDFYRALGASLGVVPRFLPVPLAALDLLVRLGEFAGIPMPITRDNLLGLSAMEFVPSEGDLARLGIEVSDYRESLRRLVAGTVNPEMEKPGIL
jgi:nucleoside-diphosphate-sugar epimerase